MSAVETAGAPSFTSADVISFRQSLMATTAMLQAMYDQQQIIVKAVKGEAVAAAAAERVEAELKKALEAMKK
ncbi:MAG: hypothetical protein P4L61_00225 [Candidatus Pacebacteria bacterium]|nr:hypothetical protein [Candidatus Paceibacterota bacterium]